MVSDDIVAGKIELLGVRWPLGRPLWHLDPVSGRKWRESPGAHSMELEGNITGDPKYVWELLRFGHLQAVALSAALEDDSNKASFISSQLRGWIEDDRPFRTVGWKSSIECAYRLFSLWTIKASVGPFDEDLEDGLALVQRDLLARIVQYPSLDSSANNHRVGELAALICAGRLSVSFANARENERLERELLEVLDALVYPDGGYAEQSPSYGARTLEWCAAVYALSESDRFRDRLGEIMLRLAAYLRELWSPAWSCPAIGDDDSSRLFWSDESLEEYPTAIVTTVATLLGRDELRLPLTPGATRTALLGGSHDGHTVKGSAPAESHCFPESGFSVQRWRSSSERECVGYFSYGDLGFGPLCAHGHADTLAVWLSIGSTPIFVDVGTYCYGRDRRVRDWYRSTAAHNTLTVDGYSSSVVAGPFSWWLATRGHGECVHDSRRASGWHHGFARLGVVTHRRTVSINDGDWEVDDQVLVGTPLSRRVEIRYFVGAGLETSLSADGVHVASGGDELCRLIPPIGFDVSISRSKPNEPLGSSFPQFGTARPIDCITLATDVGLGQHRWRTRISIP